MQKQYDNNCGSIWNWNGITGGNTCDKFRADLAFLFLASIFFLVSALLVGLPISTFGSKCPRKKVKAY
jgi:hypothetical protein